MPRKAIRVDTCAADPTLDPRSLGVPPALAAALLGARSLVDAAALLPSHPVLVVRERPSSPRHVLALRPVLRDAVALHPTRLAHLLDGAGEPLPFLLVMPRRDDARAALAARVGDDPPLDHRAEEAVAALGAESSLCLDDLAAPPEKAALVAEAERAAAAVYAHYLEGVLLDAERHHKFVDVWSYAAAGVRDALRRSTARPRGRLRALAEAGAAAPDAVLLIAGMRGVCARPGGSCFELPVRRSLAEGLTGHEFFLTASAARRRRAESVAREARSDALLRRLARRLGGVRVTEDDCGATDGVRLQKAPDREDAEAHFASRLRGRVPVADPLDPRTGEAVARAGAALDEATARVVAASVGAVEVRSPAACRARAGVCRVCMGPLGAGERHAGLAVALRVGHAARFMTHRAFHIGC